ncbi:MAG: PAS domain S-box protein, partial [Pseudomonadota bacterium]
MEVISRSQDRLSPEYSEMLFKRHLQGALVRSGASLIMGVFAIIAFYIASIKSQHLAGVGFSILFLILINPPTLWILKKIKSRLVYRYFSLLINLAEIIGYTGIIYFLGGIEATYLTPIYAALITYVGTVSPKSFPFIVAALCALAFSSMVTLEYLGYLPHQRVVYDFRPPLATQMIYVSVVIGLLFVTAYISAYTAATLKRTRNKLHRKNIELQTSVRTMSREITERKQAEEALRESEEKYRNLVEESFDGIFIQKGPNIIFANKRLNEMLGYREGELIGQNHWVVYHPDYQKLTRERAQARMRGEEVVRRYEVKLQRKDGSWFYGEINARQITFPSDEESGIQVWIKDIMEQKLAEEALRESEERYKALFERSLELVYLCDFEGNFIDANDAALELLGYTKDDIKSLNFGSLLTDDQLPLVVDTAEEILKTGSQKEVAEYKLRRKDGEYVYVESMGAIIYRKGKPYAIQGIARNITDRKQADETLRTSEAQLSNAMNIAQLGYWEYDVANDLFTFDDHFYAIFRTSAEQVGGYKMSSARYAQLFVHPDDMPVVGLETQKAIETTDPNYSRQLEHRVIYADGEIGYISVRFFIVKDNQGRTVKTYGANQNITERKRAEEKRIELEDKLQRAQRMEAMGLMAGGVAHDLNNILSGIVSYPELLLMDLPEDSPMRRPIETIQESGMR